MPISEYFGGHGSKVMQDMKDRYGEDKGERVFYATANSKGQKPAKPARPAKPVAGYRRNAS